MRDTLSPTAIAELRHELRTPVNIISGYAEMLLEDIVDRSEEDGALAVALRGIGAEMREVLRLIGSVLPANAVTVQRAQVGELLAALRVRRSSTLSFVRAALAAVENDAERDDLLRIERAASTLASVDVAVEAEHAADLSRTTEFAVAPQMVAARLLVVDDVEDNVSVLQRRLERVGHTVVTANDGDSALAIAQREALELDLILLDMRMPGRDGFDILLELKADPLTESIPVVMISALDDLASIARCIANGAEDYLPKPFDPMLLYARVGATLERKRLRDREADYLDQTMRVITAARAVEEGRYHPDLLADVGRRGDELGRLARVLDGMATEVKAREARLLAQLEELREEIDVVRGAVTDSGTGGARYLTGGGHVPSTPTLQVGQCLAGRYDIFDVAGQGGMGRVFRATDRELGGIVAIKTLRGDALRERPELRDWLKSEVRLGRRITHANVVRTYDFGEADDVAFITMEYVDGVSLRRMLETRGTLTTGSAIALGTQLFRALQAAHEQGVVHRDIKPENVLLSEEGVLKVMDFGIARLLEGSDGAEADGWGTMSYMAPEQLLNEAVDARADLYTAGVLLYEALTGELPFQGATTTAFMSAVFAGGPVPVSEWNPDVSDALSGLIDTLLAAEATDRPRDAKSVVQMLEQMR